MKTEYKGFEIQVTTCQTRFGTLFTSTNNLGEPYMEQIAYGSSREAIDAAKKDIDSCISEIE